MTLTGLFVPLVTPFTAAGLVDHDALRALARDTLTAGATGLVALGTTGEPEALTAAERDAVLATIAAVCGELGSPLIAGAHDRASLAALAARPEVTAALTLVPPFLRPGEDGALAHLAALAGSSPVPLVVYHVPYRTAQPLSPAALRRLAAVPGVAGIKLATGGIDAATVELMADPPPGLAVLGGDDAVIAPLLAMGAHGGVLASAQVHPAGFAELLRTGDLTLARRLARLSLALFAEPNPTVIKGVLHARGRIATADVRLPLLPASRASVDAAVRLTHAANSGW